MDRRRPAGAALLAFASLAFLTAFALTALSAEAHHNNPACTPGSYSQTWNGTTTLPFISIYNDECILVRGDIVLPAGSTVRFSDTDLTFANDEPGIGNITVNIANDSVWEMTDADNDPSTTQDRSGLLAHGPLNVTFGFFFNVSVNASLYINDTTINGGGLPGPGLTWRTGFYLAGLNDFAWNRVDHTFLANGLMLINFTKPRTFRVTDFAGVGPGGGYGLYMSGDGNLSFESIATDGMPYGIYINDSVNISVEWFNSTASVTGLVANRVAFLKVQDVLDNSARFLGLDFNGVTNLTVRRARLLPLASNLASYGIEFENSRDILLKDIDLANHAIADLHIWQGTQNLWAENVSIRGTNTSTSRGIWAVEAADIFRPSNFTFVSVAVAQRGEGINLTGVGRALLQYVNISSTWNFGLYTAGCFDVLFTDGTINGASGPFGTGTGAYLGGSNLILQRALIASQGLSGVEVGDSNFVIEGVTFTGNGRSIRTSGPATIGPSVIANSTVPAGSPSDAVNLIGTSSMPFTRLFVFHNNFTSPCTGGVVCYGLHIETFGRVDVVNNTFFSLPVWVANTSTLVMSGNTHRISQLPLNSVVVFFDHGLSLTVTGDTFPAPSPPLGISTVIRAPFVSASAAIFDMRLPFADLGIWVSSNPGSALLTTVTVSNVTASAKRDAVTTFGMNTVDISNLTVEAATNAVILFGGGNAQDLSVRDSMLGANGTAINLTLDSAGRAFIDNITFNRSFALPSRALSIQNGSVATASRIALDHVAAGIVTSDLRRLNLARQDFTNNSVGLRMDSPGVTSADLNWTITSATRIENTFMRFGGAVTVSGTSLTLRNATLSLYALQTSPRPTRFFVQGASTLTITDGTRITTEGASLRNAPTRFTVQMSALARLSLSSAAPWGRVLLEGLGDPTSSAPEEQGFLLQAADSTVFNVTFVNFTRALLAAGVTVSAVNCSFTGGPGAQAAITVTAGGRGLLSLVDVTNANGIEAVGGEAAVDNSSVSLGGVVLDLTNSRGTLYDSVVQLTSSIVIAHASSAADVCRVVAVSILSASFVADTNSVITVCDSSIRDVRTTIDAVASSGAVINLRNTYIDRFNEFGHNYTNDTRGGGRFDVVWSVRFAVCVLSSSENATGATVEIFNSSGSLVFSDTTDSSGYTHEFAFHEYESQGGVAQYWTPIQFVGTLGALVNSTTVYFTDQAVLQVCVDDVPPVITILSRHDSRTREANVTLEVLAVDEDSGLQIGSPCVAFSGDPGQPCDRKGENRVVRSIRFTHTRTLSEGLNWFRVEAVDLFGNTAVAWVNITLDTTGPVITSCQPPFTARIANSSVAMVCTVAGGATNATFSYHQPLNWHLDIPTGTLYANFSLTEGTSDFTISVIDDLGNYASHDLSWTVDTTLPTITFGIDTSRVVTQLGVSINGSLASDTVSLTVNGTPINFSANHFAFFANLQEGDNFLNFTALDAAGNRFERTLRLKVDTLLNCTIGTPSRGQQTPDSPILVAGHCDPDVSIVINGDLHVPVSFDGSWSTRLNLANGPNKIVIDGIDFNGAKWHAEVPVYYAPGTGESGPSLLIVFVLLTVGTVLAAFFISRRPRDHEFEPVAHSQTGSQKAPPRPKPQTVKLPETPEDLTYRPKPPMPPPPGR